MDGLAKVFRYRGGQAIRLPESFRFDCDEVCIEQVGSCLLLFPKGTPQEVMRETIAQVTQDFMLDREKPRAAEGREPF